MHSAFTLTNPFAVQFMEFNSDISEEARDFFSTLSLYTDHPEKMSSFSKSLLDRITYHTQIASTEIAFENLKKMHPSCTESDPFALAYMASNPAIPEEEREILKECFRRTVESEQKTLQRFLADREVQTNDVAVNGTVEISDNYIATSSVIKNDNVRGYENSNIDVSIGDSEKE
jgi:hypothetical protein